MEDENLNEEQFETTNPEEVESNSSADEESTEDKKTEETSEAERGVPIGKFKNVDDLVEAYNNLQAEFTRKCQKLSALEKDKIEEEKKANEMDAKLNRFLLENQEAYSYIDEIKARVNADESLKNSDEPFDKVWSNMIIEKFSSQNRVNEPIFQNLVLKNDEVKNLIIENYVKQLQNNETPFVMSSELGERVTDVVTQKPNSFEEAKNIVLNMFS